MGKLSFGTTGLSYQPKKVEIGGGAPKCQRCEGRVYFNEEKKALGKSWHARCFNCASCKKSLDVASCAGHDGEVYCTRCHRKEFGPKGYGFAGGMAGLSTESSYHDVRPVEPIQTQTVAQHIPSKTIDRDHKECCPRCGKRVYFAEEVKALRRKWHKLCFKCVSCSSHLEASRCNEHNGEVFCKSCYGRFHGPSGYGYACGAGTMLASEPLANRTNSVNGHNGVNGVNGHNGTNGHNGFNGHNGVNGHNGTNGMNDYYTSSDEDSTPREMTSHIAGSHQWTEGVTRQMPPSVTKDMRSTMAGTHEWTEGVLI